MNHFRFRRLAAMVLALVLLLSTFCLPILAAEDNAITIRDNVYRIGVGVRVAMTDAVADPENDFSITGPDGEVVITSISVENTRIYTLVPAEPLDLEAEYTLHYLDQSCPVYLPSIYSTEEFEEAYTYDGDDLGATWTKDKTAFRLWAPTADSVVINLYKSGDQSANDLIETIPMTADVKGTWIAEKGGDLNGTYYTYTVEVDGKANEACDPYARAVGVNGNRAMVIDLDSTDPEGWDTDKDPNGTGRITDAIIYELHVRDLSIDESSGITNKGKYLGLIETGTKNPSGAPTGLDHIKNLGVTHIHLLPVYDYATVDESKLDNPQFNWGYDPKNYNVPEGSYSTDPFNGEVRVKEFKQMVKGLHDNGISVIMDVVYNHVYNAETFCFNLIVPQYFSRVNEKGHYSQGSGCGNDNATERSMVKKYIVDSVKYWADEYHIDGFRFDLVGLIDTETINEVVSEVRKTHPNVIFYGEGWDMNTTLTKDGYTMATQANSQKTPGFAYFSDTIRDALRGPMGSANSGYISGAGSYSSTIANCFMGLANWCKSPSQAINYASCHDNNTLFDRIAMSNKDDSFEDRVKMNNLAAAIVMTSQGTPLFQAGEELLRSKPLPDGTFDHNSYKSPDSVNSIKWNDLDKEAYQNTYNYYAGLIAFRKAHPALRMPSAGMVTSNITRLDGDLDPNVLAFQTMGGINGEVSDSIVTIFNPRSESTNVVLPEGEWTIYVNAEQAGTTALGTVTGSVTVDAISAMVLVRDTNPNTQAPSDQAPAKEPKGLDPVFIAGVIGVLLLAASVVMTVVILVKHKK